MQFLIEERSLATIDCKEVSTISEYDNLNDEFDFDDDLNRIGNARLQADVRTDLWDPRRSDLPDVGLYSDCRSPT